MQESQVITIINSKGEKEQLEVIDDIKLEKNNYVIVSPIGSDVAFAYKSMVKNGEAEYISVGAGPEFDKVLAAYNSKE